MWENERKWEYGEVWRGYFYKMDKNEQFWRNLYNYKYIEKF